MTETYVGATFSDGTDTVVTPQPAPQEEYSFRRVATRSAGSLAFTVSSAALAGTPLHVTVIVSPTVGGSEHEPTDEELLAAGRAFIADFERDFGPIPEEVIADIRRTWRT